MKNNKYLGTTILTQNSKMRHTSKLNGVKVVNFSLPAYKSTSGKIVCPFAGDCKNYCYARKGRYHFTNVQRAQDNRYKLTKDVRFKMFMSDAIASVKPHYVRIHDSGDFYSPQYLSDWLEIIKVFPHVKFYAYTKSVPLFQFVKLPHNFRVIFSYGGRFDNLITDLPHAVIFNGKMDPSYLDASQNDLLVYDSNKIGLQLH